MTRTTITFVCFKHDEPIAVQLKPEAFWFKVLPGNELSFVGIAAAKLFKWITSVDYLEPGTQLFPEGWPHEIEIFENGVLLEDWYKYMR